MFCIYIFLNSTNIKNLFALICPDIAELMRRPRYKSSV